MYQGNHTFTFGKQQYTHRRNYMLSKLLERLAEMFPKQDYQSRLNDYIASHKPQTAGDVDQILRKYTQTSQFYHE